MYADIVTELAGEALDAVNAENAALKFQIKEYGKRKPFFQKIIDKIREAKSC